MLKTLKKAVIIILASLGVLFIVLMLMPDEEDTDDTSYAEAAYEESEAVTEQEEVPENVNAAELEETQANGNIAGQEEAPVVTNSTGKEETQAADNSNGQVAPSGNSVTVSIPESELSAKTLKFSTISLEGDVVTQDIFSDYDITVVHIWGTFCIPCIREMGEYASFYDELPDNVNLVGLICDVYDGLDSNVSDAKDILNDAGAKFPNIRVSDDLYDVVSSFQYVPSAFLVDKEGHIVGEMMDGALFSDTKARLEKYLN